MSTRTTEPFVHACRPDLETMRVLRAGEASSVKRRCLLCRADHVWIQRAMDGEIVVLEARGGRRA